MGIQDFLLKAHKATYASDNTPDKNELGAKQFVFKEKDYEYVDYYFGGKIFIGTEVIKQAGKAIWGMNYYGRVISDIDHDIVYDFLKKTLSRPSKGMLFRGPKSFKNKEWTYHYSYKGSFDNFLAKEIIKYKGKKIYEAIICGGSID